MAAKDDIVDAVESGARTSQQIASHAGLAKSTVRKQIKQLYDEGEVERERSGDGFRYYPPGEAGDDDNEDDGRMGNFFPSAAADAYGNDVVDVLDDMGVGLPEEVAEELDELSPEAAEKALEELSDEGEVGYDDQSGLYFIPDEDEDGGDEDTDDHDPEPVDEDDPRDWVVDQLQEEAGRVETAKAHMAEADATDVFDFGNNADDGLIPASRDYDWERRVPDDPTGYVEYDDELVEMKSGLATRWQTDKFPRFTLEGPSGTAKTLLAENIASDLDAPMFTLQCSPDMGRADIQGRVHIDDGTYWTDGTVTEAVLASREGPAVLLIDEANRAPSRRQTDLFPVLDHRCGLVLTGRGGELVHGNPLNLIVIATINTGKEYTVEPIDAALAERLGSRFMTQYLGMSDVEAEADLVTDGSSIDKETAYELVEAANAVREQAEADANRNVKTGISPRVVTSWAQMSVAHHKAGLDDPVMRAARSEIVNAKYDGDGAQEVEKMLDDRLNGAAPEVN